MESPIEFALKLNMYGQPPETDFEEFIDLAVLAEELGFAGVYTIDHLVLPQTQWVGFSEVGDEERPYFPETWTALAAIAARTKRVRLGPQVTPISLRHPVFIAKMAANIDRISHGRLVLQVGTGWHREEYEAFGFEFDEAFSVRFEKMLEGVDMIRRLWTEDAPVTYRGNHYRLEQAPFWPKPVQKPMPPIWFGGTGAKVRDAVAQYGDAWTPAAPHRTGLRPDFYNERLGEIRTKMEGFGRNPDALLAGALFFVVIADDRRTAEIQAEKLRRREDWADITVDEMRELGVALVGDPDDVSAQLQKYVDAGVRHFTLGFVPISSSEVTATAMRLFADQVMPRFAEAGTRATA